MRKATLALARQSTSTSRLRELLERALRRQRGAEDEPLDGAAIAALVEPVIARLQRAGLLDDDAFARARARSLAAKGKPAGAIAAELAHRYGVRSDDPNLAEMLAGLDPHRQAERLAERRRLGPYRLRDRARKRDADIASLVRAGFGVAVAMAVIDATADGVDDEGGARSSPGADVGEIELDP